jgi:serine/threonine-protein kinase
MTATNFEPKDLLVALAHRVNGDHESARASFEAARVRIDSAMKELPDDWRLHAARGVALAGVGRREEALREADWLQRSDVYREDAYFGPRAREIRAQILADAGATDAALDEIEYQLATPSFVTVHTLRLEPRWDPIRNQPRFKALLAKYSASEAR